MTDEYISEQQRQYTKKNLDRTTVRNPLIKCNALNFIKPFEDTHLRLAPKPLQEPKSIYKIDFNKRRPQIQDEKMFLKLNCSSVESAEKLRIDRSKPGYSKYLDVSATSNLLDYFPITLDQQRGIGAKDNITYWTWIKNETNKKYSMWPIRQNLLDKFKTNKYCEHRRCGEFQIMQNSVPNTGLTTETKSNYKIADRSLDLAFKCVCDQIARNE